MSELDRAATVDQNEQESISAYSQLLEALEPGHPLRTQPEQVAVLVRQLTLEEIGLLQVNAVPDVEGPVSETEVSDNGVLPSDAIQDNLAWIEDFCRTLSVAKERFDKNMPSQDHLSLGGTDLTQENVRLQEQVGETLAEIRILRAFLFRQLLQNPRTCFSQSLPPLPAAVREPGDFSRISPQEVAALFGVSVDEAVQLQGYDDRVFHGLPGQPKRTDPIALRSCLNTKEGRRMLQQLFPETTDADADAND